MRSNTYTLAIATATTILTICALVAGYKSLKNDSKKANKQNSLKSDKKKRNKAAISVPSGLINVGNSCYLNSIIQLLAAAEQTISDHFDTCGLIGNELSKLISRINLGLQADKRGFKPLDFIKSFTGKAGFSYEQQDAHEFLLALLNLNSTSNTLKKSLSMSISDVKDGMDHCFQVKTPFTGVMMNELICLPCATKRKPRHISSLKIEPFSCVTLTSCHSKTLNEAVYQQFCVPEKFSDYMNAGCGFGAINQKNPLLFPDLLFLHISLLSESFQKSSENCEIVEELSGPGYRYKLLGLIVHYGPTGHAGHFVCFRRFGADKWIECDDSSVKIVEIDQVLKQKAYILLYLKD